MAWSIHSARAEANNRTCVRLPRINKYINVTNNITIINNDYLASGSNIQRNFRSSIYHIIDTYVYIYIYITLDIYVYT